MTMAERLKVRVAVYLVLQRDGKYLFVQRKNTDYRNGFYSLPAGHVDPGELPTEAMVREAQEEVGVTIAPIDLQFAHVLYREDVLVEYFFVAAQWQGEPVNNEPEKIGDLRWATLAELGANVVEEVAAALPFIEQGVAFSEMESSS